MTLYPTPSYNNIALMTSTASTGQGKAASSRQWKWKNLAHKAAELSDLGISVGAATKLVEENITTMDSSSRRWI
ncbi:hypothetical protein D8674_008951 [Pyrus ussuriensis x Pyrus communis]|uniref:Uncharacterized protein n=1 Tax=Pyrus ussuriensis x Pyrus communis TaxID=2448454 RepID=A0A5N5HZ77_9ROSA|nr:hypothetical protein D8674_008951 [Pyrus ussuriensis x Pyrus communis]